MKNTSIKIISLLLALIMVLGCLPVLTAAAAPVLWAAPVDGEAAAEKPISAVKWWYDTADAVYYLFMPTDGDLAKMQVWFENASTCSIDGAEVANGQQMALTAGNHTVVMAGTSYPLTVMKSGNIGSLYITTESGNMNYIHAKKGNKESGMVKYVDANGKVKYDGVLDEIKGRGNATWSRAKKPYQFKLDKKTDLIGAGKHKTWILLANYLERSLIRNRIAYDLANDAGLDNSCRSAYTDLYCNGQYMGTFQLCEKVQIGDNRIEINNLEDAIEDVNELDPEDYPTFGDETANGKTPSTGKGVLLPNDPEDITGGYLLELDYADRYATEISGFVTSRGQAVTIKEPECASPAMVEYISTFFQEFEDAVFAPDGKNPKTSKYYYEYFDLSSLARKYIIEELTNNIDADVTSQYYYKPSDKESTVGYCGPVWDYDNSMGNYSGSTSTTGFRAQQKKYIYYQLNQKQSFKNALVSEWNVNFVPQLKELLGEADPNPDTLTKNLYESYEELSPAAAMNFTYWSNLATPDNQNYTDTGSTFKEHYDYLQNLLSGRSAWLSEQWTMDSVKLGAAIAAAGESTTTGIMNYNGKHTTYTVSNETELQYMADLITAGNNMKGITILQTRDITLTKNFTPGGYSNTDNVNPALSKVTNTFNGTYNGQGYKIYNLQINVPQQNGAGVFASAYGATFKDMHIASGYVYSYNRAAGITGYGDACTFIRCSNGANIEVNPESTDGAGGLAGVAREGATFDSCYNTGSVTGHYIGGMAGWGQTNITIKNCFNLGTLTLPKNKGEAESLSRTGSNRNFQNCYYLDTCGAGSKNGATALTTAQFKTLAATMNQVSDIWEQGPNHPVHKAVERTALTEITVETYVKETLVNTELQYYARDEEAVLNPGNRAFISAMELNGQPYNGEAVTLGATATLKVYLTVDATPISEYNGTGDYYLTSAIDLQKLLDLTKDSDLKGSTFYLLNNVNASDITESGQDFGGTLNGKFSTIQGLKVPLFKNVTATGDVRKLSLINAEIDDHGLVASMNNHGKISYITVDNVLIRGNAAIAKNNVGIINACSVSGMVVGVTNAAAISETNYGTIQNCINHARIVAPNKTAAGITVTSDGNVKSCVNMGMVNGGIVYTLTEGTAIDSYNWAWVKGTTNGGTDLSDAELTDPDFVENLPSLYWQEGKNGPAPATTLYELGDASGDQKVTIYDVVLLLRYLNDLVDEDSFNLEAADVNGDGFKITDCVLLLQSLVGKYDF